MPITQDRLISLINAATDYQTAFQAVRQLLSRELTSVRTGAITPVEALSNIETYFAAPQAFLQHPTETIETVARERAHFQATMRHNRRAARRAEAKRRRDGVPIARQQPGPFIEPGPGPRHEPRPAPAPASAPAILSSIEITDPDLTDDLTFTSEFQPESKLPAETRRIIDIEAELYDNPAGHDSRVRIPFDPQSEIISCQCGWEGPFSKWPNHWQGAKT